MSTVKKTVQPLVALPIMGLFFLAFSLLGLFQTSASAQTLPDISRPQTAGEWGQVYMPVVEQQGTLGIGANTDELEIKGQEGVPLIEQRLLEALEKQGSVLFENVVFEGNSQIQASVDLTQYQHKALNLVDLNQLARLVYEASSKETELNKIIFKTDDTFLTLTITATPLQIEKVIIEGNKHLRTSAVERLMGIPKGTHSHQALLSVGQANRRLRLIQDNPDIGLEASYETTTEDKNHVNLKLKVKETRPIHLAAFTNNLDQSFYGDMLSGITTTINNLTGNADSLMITPIIDNRTRGVYAHYEIPINAYGTRIGVDYATIRANPTKQGFDEFQIKGRYWGVTTSIYQPLIAKAGLRLSTDLNLDVRQAKTTSKFASLDTDGDENNEIYTNTELENERLRDLRWGIQLQKTTEKNEFFTRQEATVGLPIANATLNSASNLANVGGGSQFFRYISSFYYKHSLPWQTALVLNAAGQWSPGTLSSADLGGIGGTYFGRGYPEAFLQADSLIFASAEYRTPFFLAPKTLKIPFTGGTTFRDSIQLLAFTDYGFAKNNNRSLVDDPNACIASVGVGARIQLAENITGRLDFGIPLVKQPLPDYNSYGPRLHFGVSYKAF